MTWADAVKALLNGAHGITLPEFQFVVHVEQRVGRPPRFFKEFPGYGIRETWHPNPYYEEQTAWEIVN